ncbi:MAG: hypothetical protein ACREDF_06825, partial [Thermoplasmata archaeon]
MSGEADLQCPVCGATNPPHTKACGTCGVAFTQASSTTKVDALLDDLLEVKTTPLEERKGEAEELFDSLLVEIQS